MKKIVSILLVLMMLAAGSAVAEMTVGGWSIAESASMTDDIIALFNEATGKLMGVSYEPVAYLGSQVVAGTNHCFLAKATVIYPDAQPSYKLVYIWQNPQGEVTVDAVRDFDFTDKDGLNSPRVLHAYRYPEVSEDQLPGQTFTALINDYTEDGVVSMQILMPVLFDGGDVEGLKAGDVLEYEGEAIYLETVCEEDGAYLLNEDSENLVLYELEDGSWEIREYEDNLWIDIGTAEVLFAENFTFEDGIDPASGEILDNDTVMTEDEFMVEFSTEQENEGIGFASFNVHVTFDEDGNLLTLRRFYTPWQ